jgi:hypothetical protein
MERDAATDAAFAVRFTKAEVDSAPSRSYADLKPADALAHLNEKLAEECARFERDLSLEVTAIKVKRDKDTGELIHLRATLE